MFIADDYHWKTKSGKVWVRNFYTESADLSQINWNLNLAPHKCLFVIVVIEYFFVPETFVREVTVLSQK